uniref:Prostatic acid phosphatase-like n=1 Tax=Caenorhabditis tropicalis TaxID=1561998 RepID=A0A1I7UDJ2_9PELO
MRILWILILVSTPFGALADSDDGFKLVYTQVLFRHGARAPTERITDPAYESAFPRGLGEMTDRGFENSYRLGEFLGNRYVKSGFLNANLKPTEMYWRSVNKNRCLSSASAVGYGMFDDKVRHLHVPVLTEEVNEDLLNYDQTNCHKELDLVKAKCPDFDGILEPWPKYEAFIAKCLNYTHPVFADYPFETLEAYINQYKNSIPLPKELEPHIDHIMSLYVKVTQFITGTGYHHDPRMMRIKFGYLVKKLLGNLRGAISGIQQKAKIRKFTVYSTQDWILMGVLDSFGVLKETVGLEVYPEYNSMILIELFEKNDEFFVKMLYKREEITSDNHQLIDVSHLVRNCPRDQMYCPIKAFLACCKEYEEEKGKGCDVDKRRRARSVWKWREPRFAGPA